MLPPCLVEPVTTARFVRISQVHVTGNQPFGSLLLFFFFPRRLYRNRYYIGTVFAFFLFLSSLPPHRVYKTVFPNLGGWWGVREHITGEARAVHKTNVV